MPYHLVHIVTGGEFKTPLVATQLFDRAQTQATLAGENKPLSVSVWIVEPMREVFDDKSKKLVSSLRERCPDISIHLIGGVSRLNGWPVIYWLKILRRKLGKSPVVYHCRGESSHDWGIKMKARFHADRTVLDIRGFWPLERLSAKDIYDDTNLGAADAAIYEADCLRLKESVMQTDKLTTVSIPLQKYLVQHFGAAPDSLVIPCCVSDTVDDANREKIRTDLNLHGKYAILYLGGTQKYQHLEDLVLPFLQAAIKVKQDTIAVFITQNKEKMLHLIQQFGLAEDRFRILSVSQDKVADYLTAMDAGLLLRAPSPLNNFAQPVKLGEYLGAGLPVIVEKGTGEVATLLGPDDIGYEVTLMGKNGAEFDAEVSGALNWIAQGAAERRARAKVFVDKCYTWKVNVPLERILYMKSLGNNIKTTL